MNKILLIIGLLILGGFATFLFIISLPQQRTSAPNNLTLISVSPQNGSVNVASSPNIILTFSRALTENERKTISVVIAPQVENALFWEKENDTAKIVLGKNLSFQTNYTITINYGVESFSWHFTTTTAPVPSITTPAPNYASTSAEQVLLNQQAQEDSAFAKGQQDFLKAYPWYNNLPPVNDEYFIDFDFTSNQFIVELYPHINNSMSINDQINHFKNDVLVELQSIGVDISSYKIDWTIVPQ
ncbi:MAG TPA: Ig-like domain-containing protein [Patescibacteria group bacterium]|jgi:hypothetical protein|nr:Ig-like domain-containing protein [Patescibacteria group bacterium]